MRISAFIIVTIALASLLLVPASASSITINVATDHINAKFVLSLHQNMTTFPNESTTVSGLQDGGLTSAFSDALAKVEPSAKISNMTLKVFSNNTWLNLTATMTITGVFDKHGDLAEVNSTWKSLNVVGDLRAGNLSYNDVGKTYLRPALEFYVNASKFENLPNATIKAVTFFVNQTISVTGEVAANQVGNMTVLDFRPLSVPLEQWNRTYHLLNDTTTWQYIPPLPSLSASIRANKGNQSLYAFSVYSYDAEVAVPGLARANGNIVMIDVGSGQQEWAMAGIVVVAIIAAIAAQIAYRAKRRTARLARR